MKKNAAIVLFALIGAIGLGCEDEEVESGFITESALGTEGDGTQSIEIDLGKTTSESTTITFQVAGDAGLDGDYTVDALTEFASDSPFKIVVPEGESKATITFNLIDDAQVESRNEVIFFQITDVSDESIANTMKRSLFAYEIKDNDSAPTSGLQVDLSWTLGNSVRINASNFDLYLASDITLQSNGEVASFEKVEQFQSANRDGFETYVLDDNIEDREYYIIIAYVTGTHDANITLHFAQGNDYGSASGRVSSSFVGKYVYYGPVTKTGSSYNFR